MSYYEQNSSLCTLYGVWGDDFHNKNLKLKNKIFLLHLKCSCYHWLTHRPWKADGNIKASPSYEGAEKQCQKLLYIDSVHLFLSSDKFRLFN